MENDRTDGTSTFNIGRSAYIPFGWCGMAHDEYTGRYHTQYRDYDPVHARWLSEDPAGYQDGLNLYAAYMGVMGIDPLGLRDSDKDLPDWATADAWDVLANPNGYSSEDLDDSYMVGSVSDLMKFPEGRLAIGMYMSKELNGHTTTGSMLSTAIDRGFFEGDEFYFEYQDFMPVGQIKSLIRGKQAYDYAPIRIQKLTLFLVEQAATEVVTAGVGYGVGLGIKAFVKSLRAAGAGSKAVKAFSFMDDAARGSGLIDEIYRSGCTPTNSAYNRVGYNKNYFYRNPSLSANGTNPNILNGHGTYSAKNGVITVPQNTSVTVWGEHNTRLANSVAQYIDQGKIPPQKSYNKVLGAKSYMPGANMPNYTLSPIDPSWVLGNPTTVSRPTLLDKLLNPHMGNVNWSACTLVVE